MDMFIHNSKKNVKSFEFIFLFFYNISSQLWLVEVQSQKHSDWSQGVEATPFCFLQLS